MKLSDIRINMQVYFMPLEAKGNIAHSTVEQGLVTGVTPKRVMVRFRNYRHSLSCDPNELMPVGLEATKL